MVGDFTVQSQIISLNAARTVNVIVPTEASEPGDGELRSQHPDAMVESSISIESTPTTEFQNDFDSVALQNVEHHSLPSAAPTSALGDSLEEQPNDEPSFIVVEIESTTPIPRGVSEGIEVASFVGDVSDLDGEYVVEEPPTTEASVVGLTSKYLSSSKLRILCRSRRFKPLAQSTCWRRLFLSHRSLLLQNHPHLIITMSQSSRCPYFVILPCQTLSSLLGPSIRNRLLHVW